MKGIFILIITTFLIISCQKSNEKVQPATGNLYFSKNNLKINKPVKQVLGQNLYLPIYSIIPYKEAGNYYPLSAFVAVHNTDFSHPIKINAVYYFDNDGILVKDFLNGNEHVLYPLGTTNYFIPESGHSGLGANFIIEWHSDTLVNEPLIESVMVSLTNGQGVSFSSKGTILNEIK